MYRLVGTIPYTEYNLGARIYLCRALWELQDLDRLLFSLHAFNQFISRQKETLVESVTSYRRFVGYMTQMAKAAGLPAEKASTKFLRIQQKVNKNESPNQYSWLRKQLSEAIG